MSGVTDPRNLGHAVESFLRARYPSKTVDNVVADTGLSAHQVGKWLEGANAPSGSAMVALTCAYGPEFLAAVMPQRFEWLDEGLRAARRAALKSEIAARERELESIAP